MDKFVTTFIDKFKIFFYVYVLLSLSVCEMLDLFCSLYFHKLSASNSYITIVSWRELFVFVNLSQ